MRRAPQLRLLSLSARRRMGIQDSIRVKLEEALQPSELIIENDSSKHAGHSAMRGNTSGETHFTVRCTSARFEGQPTIKRHRAIHALLKDEFDSGLHALILVTKSPKEASNEPVAQADAPEMPERRN